MKKVICILLVLSIALALLPAAVLADGGDTWQNATVLTADTDTAYTLPSYNSTFANGAKWFKVDVTTPNQALKLNFNGITTASPLRVSAYLFSGSTLQASGASSGNSMKSWTSMSADASYTYKVPSAGAYYIMLKAYGASYVSSTPAYLSYSIIEPDANEGETGNDTWQTATELTRNVNTYYTLNGSNDADWFKMTTTVPGEAIKIVFSNFDYTVNNVSAYIYSGAKLEAGSTSSLADKKSFYVDGTLSYKCNTPGDYYVKVVPYDSTGYVTKGLKIRYETVPGDEYELNDSFGTATPVPDEFNCGFTLNGINDVDWFCFETSTENELVNINFSGFDTDAANKITYYVYDATDTGYNSSSLANQSIYLPSSKAMTFANVGLHYIKVVLNSNIPVEDTLYLRISRGAIDNGEPNDTWQTANTLYEGTAIEFNLPSNTDIDWFKVTVTEPNQTIKLKFAGIPSGGSVSWSLYSGAALNTYGLNNASSLLYGNAGSGASTYYYMFSNAGDYYIRLKSYSSTTIFNAMASISYKLIAPDENENNNSWKSATPLNEEMNTAFSLPAANDIDWFKVTVTEPNQTIKLKFAGIPSGGEVYWSLYSGADLNTYGLSNTSYLTDYTNTGSGASTYYYMFSNAGDYYIKVKPNSTLSSMSSSAMATIGYELIAPDENEYNNSWKSATPLNEEMNTAFSLPAANDVDWFKVTVTEPNQTIKLKFAGIPSGGEVYWRLYSGADLNTYGLDNASNLTYCSNTGSGASTYYYMFSNAGDYYIKVKPNSVSSSMSSSAMASISYELIAPDENEYNNSCSSSTPLHPNTPAFFTISAGNDYDWFKLDAVEIGDSLKVNIGNTGSATTQTMYVYLYYVAEGETSAASLGYFSAGSTASHTWTVSNAGDYYLRLSLNGSTPIFGTRYMTYSIARDNTPVTNVSVSQPTYNMYVGESALLYANVMPSFASNPAVTWGSSDQTVVTVDSAGKITAMKQGTARITATTADGGYTSTCTVTVSPAISVKGVSLDPGCTEASPKFLALGSCVQLNAVITPENATNTAVTWAVSDESVLNVTKYGKVYAVGSGTAKVTVTTNDGSHSADCWFNVPDESYPVKGVSINQNTLTIYMGELGTTLRASVYPSYADNQQVRWSSDNPSVATVDEYGCVSPVEVGYATITVTTEENGFTATCMVSVQPERVRVSGINISTPDITLGIYGTAKLDVIFDPAEASDKTVSWSSSNKAVATVSRTGIVTAMGIGTAVITAVSADGEYEATCTVVVQTTADIGDVNNDGDIDTPDAVLILRYSVGLTSLTQDQQIIADVNGDGYVDAADAILVLRYYVGLIDTFPVNA